MARSGARTLLPLLAALLALSGCAGAPAGDGDPTGDSDAEETQAEAAPPSSLVGLWRVSVEGVDADAWLQIGSSTSPGSLTYLGECGAVHGSWRAQSGAWLADSYGASGTCKEADEVGWLERTAGYAAREGGMALLDADGNEIAALAVDGEPPANPELSDEYRQPPELTDDELAALDAEPAPLPHGMAAPSAEDVVGRWLPLESYSTDPFLELAADGTWTGSDGCNGQSGRWVLGAEGGLLATAGVQTLIGCEGHSLGSSLASAARWGLDGDRLTFYDVAGEVIDEARRA